MNPHLMIDICQILLDKLLNLVKWIQWLINQKEQILVFDGDIIEFSIIHVKAEALT